MVCHRLFFGSRRFDQRRAVSIDRKHVDNRGGSLTRTGRMAPTALAAPNALLSGKLQRKKAEVLEVHVDVVIEVGEVAALGERSVHGAGHAVENLRSAIVQRAPALAVLW